MLVSARKVHLVVEYTRNRADGSVVTRHQNLWIITHDAGRWGPGRGRIEAGRCRVMPHEESCLC